MNTQAERYLSTNNHRITTRPLYPHDETLPSSQCESMTCIHMSADVPRLEEPRHTNSNCFDAFRAALSLKSIRLIPKPLKPIPAHSVGVIDECPNGSVT